MRALCSTAASSFSNLAPTMAVMPGSPLPSPLVLPPKSRTALYSTTSAPTTYRSRPGQSGRGMSSIMPMTGGGCRGDCRGGGGGGTNACITSRIFRTDRPPGSKCETPGAKAGSMASMSTVTWMRQRCGSAASSHSHSSARVSGQRAASSACTPAAVDAELAHYCANSKRRPWLHEEALTETFALRTLVWVQRPATELAQGGAVTTLHDPRERGRMAETIVGRHERANLVV